MTGTPAFPEEVLALIFSFLRPPRDLLHGTIDLYVDAQDELEKQKTLAFLCRVSKQCCRLAQPFLYHTINLLAERRPGQGSIKVQKLVRTLIYQPALTTYIVKILMESRFLEGESEEGDAWDLSYEDAVDSSRAFDQDEASRQHLLENLRDGRRDAHTALLIAMSQDAQSMRIALPKGHCESIGRVLFHAGCGSDPSVESNSLALSSLKVLALKTPENYPISSFDNTNLLSLPTLEVFLGYGMDCTGDESQYDIFISNLTRIDLLECRLDATGLKLLLQACPKLENLAISWGIGDTSEDPDIDCSGIGEQLRQYGRSLKKLTLDMSCAELDFDETGGLGDLSPMKALTRLTVPADVLVGGLVRTDITLPTSLEYLDIDLAGFIQDEEFWLQLRNAAEMGSRHHLVAITCEGGRGRRSETFWSKANGFEI